MPYLSYNSNPPWWYRRTRLERILCVFVFLSIVLSLALVTFLAAISIGQSSVTSGHRQAKRIAGFGRDDQSETAPKTAAQNGHSSDVTKDNVCLTPGCVKAAADILRNIDDKVDPCDDFYRYSCGNWIDSQVIPEDKTSVSLFSVVQDELDNKLRNLIERKPRPDESPIVMKMRNLYDSCMNTSK